MNLHVLWKRVGAGDRGLRGLGLRVAGGREPAPVRARSPREARRASRGRSPRWKARWLAFSLVPTAGFSLVAVCLGHIDWDSTNLKARCGGRHPFRSCEGCCRECSVVIRVSGARTRSRSRNTGNLPAAPTPPPRAREGRTAASPAARPRDAAQGRPGQVPGQARAGRPTGRETSHGAEVDPLTGYG